MVNPIKIRSSESNGRAGTESDLDKLEVALYLSPFVIGGTALGDDEGEVVLLLPTREILHGIHDRSEQRVRGQMRMRRQQAGEAGFPEFASLVVARFGNPVGIEYQRVAGFQARLGRHTFPI